VLQDIAKEGKTPVQTLTEQFNDTVARILRATGVQQDGFSADFERLVRVWFDLPESVRFLIQKWSSIGQVTRCKLDRLVNDILGEARTVRDSEGSSE